MASYHHGSLPAALLAAAETILQRDGIGALTLRAAAREAGVSHTAPAHHFGDLTGLLSALAASGFARLSDFARAEADAKKSNGGEKNQLLAHARGYVAFARAHPGLFQLMFRSERLDWSLPALERAARDAYTLLMPATEALQAKPDAETLADMLARWSYVHGLAMLLIDGRFSVSASMVPGADEEALIAELLGRMVWLDGETDN